jgi:hypothetical protein
MHNNIDYRFHSAEKIVPCFYTKKKLGLGFMLLNNSKHDSFSSDTTHSFLFKIEMK